jgi:site-specific DNA-methyltransferase (adenine-specific)
MKSTKNKTLTVTKTEIKNFKHFLSVPEKFNSKDLINKIYLADALKGLTLIPNNSIDLIITDPPYNIGKEFGKGKIKIDKTEFKNWCEKWIKECAKILKPTGSIYICIDHLNSGMIQELLEKNFIVRNRITWSREKGRGSKTNWKNNMEDIWFATKSDNYTFNLEQIKIKKQVIAPYVDKQGKAKDWFEENGKKFRYTHPSNIWTDMTVPFWSMPENTQHPTQKPEKLIERLTIASSNEKDLIIDPFLGSGTTAVVAKKLNRKYLGFEIEKKFYILSHTRLNKISQLNT